MSKKVFEKIISVILVAIMLIGAVPTLQFSTLAASDTSEDLIFTAKEIYDLAEPGIWGDKYGCLGYDEVTHYNKNGTEFVRLLSAGGAGTAEAYFHLFCTPHAVAPVMAIKYRTQTSGITMQVFSDSVNQKPVAASCTGITITKALAKAPPMTYAIIIENTSIRGLRTAVRITIIKDIWT